MRMREPQVQACRQILPQQTQCQQRHNAAGGSEDGSREVRERSGRLPGVLSVQRLLFPTAADGHVRRAGEGVRGRNRHSGTVERRQALLVRRSPWAHGPQARGKRMTGVLHAAIMALQALPPEALSHADDVTVHKFHRLVMEWIQRSAKGILCLIGSGFGADSTRLCPAPRGRLH
jgi:hypothetical protein